MRAQSKITRPRRPWSGAQKRGSASQRGAMLGESGGSLAHVPSIIRSKRLLDTAVVILSLPVVAPVAVATAFAISLSDGRPVLFRQKRLGYQEKVFEVLKFRTMRISNGTEGDRNRITPLGAMLRKTSLDELPQLVNVVRGEMALVGPRPLFPEYKDYYTPRERIRHAVRPGITGHAPVNGRNSARWPQRLELDAEYVENLSLRGDCLILIRTLVGVLKREGVSLVAGDTGEPLHIERSYPSEGDIRLRRLNFLDVDKRVEWMGDPSTARYMQFPKHITRESTIAWLKRVKEDPWRDDFVVANEKTGMIHAMLGLKSEPGATDGLLYIFTDPQRRGDGLGLQAMQLLIDWAYGSRYETIMLTVDEHNLAAVKLYERLGFARTSTLDGRSEYELEVGVR